MATVSLESITRRFQHVTAIENITFEIPDGEFWVLIGPSGCGKSTILRTIAGLDTATSGNVYIGDTCVNRLPARQRDVAMVFQNYALYPHMTVADNLSFGLRMRGVDRNTIRDRVERVAKGLDLASLLDRKPKQLSGGQQQRVALGRAIVREPQVFLLDEPLSNLDAQLRDEMRAQLKELHQQFRVTTIYVTHDRVEAMTLADRIVVLDGGRIQQIGTPLELYARPSNRMVASFLGSPPMNLLDGTYDGTQFEIARQPFPPLPDWQGLKPGQRVELGIRPEDVEIADADTGHFPVCVSIVEPLGRETLVRAIVSSAEDEMLAILNFFIAPTQPLNPGDRVWVRFPLDRMFAFDPRTGQVQHYPRSSKTLAPNEIVKKKTILK
ncbi:MAG: sn-glycerol-3-phosphate ABC transporter ATP-binding protein UgpC [Cyanobacteria bacterium SID2]|nr:sn-glycerol-3-phosphate ABC transporter ATP-binding protein UgpC [Cyanobacteria bacterium SID2]MBP0004805.1 sn-glycerol-3-phosphate ABC transporter ATP-binding protein UgpC [Cyanobacteria bacterium SBC]